MDEQTKQPLQSPPSSNRRLALLLCLFLLLAGLTIGYIVGTRNAQPIITTLPTPSANISPIQTQDSTTNPDQIGANWKTYVHKDYHYTVKIPPEFVVDERFYPSLHITKSDPANRTNEADLDDVNIWMWDPPQNCATNDDCYSLLEKTYQKAKNAGSLTKYFPMSTIISGQSVKGISSWEASKSQWIDEYPLSLNGKLFELKFVIDRTKEPLPGQKDLAHQILSTFKFTDQNPTPTVAIEGRFCGGIAANLPQNQCPSGYYCKLDGNYPDAGGKCVKE